MRARVCVWCPAAGHDTCVPSCMYDSIAATAKRALASKSNTRCARVALHRRGWSITA